jgi:hypothetical protein
MLSRKIVFVLACVAVVMTGALVSFAAEEVTIGAQGPESGQEESAVTTVAPQETVPAQSESDTQWAWGEVVSLDETAKTITLKYLDYETDQEKDIILVLDDKTVFENIKGFEDIKVKDALSVDYTVAPDGKNIARNIGLENPESSAVLPAQTAEAKNSEPETVSGQQAPVQEADKTGQPDTAGEAEEFSAQE